uniref:Joining chain of multimeric IgA and IgM n=1 Tax=Equus caballus TaxID=9796 RepID=A0A9L0STF7_HORSE
GRPGGGGAAATPTRPPRRAEPAEGGPAGLLGPRSPPPPRLLPGRLPAGAPGLGPGEHVGGWRGPAPGPAGEGRPAGARGLGRLGAGDEGERIVLADNKCKCVRVTSRIIPSPENPNEDILERHIRIIIPVNSRENISDPTSPVRTKFVYHLSDLCKKCDPVEVELDNQVVTASQSNICDEESETCYAYDRNKCYTNRVPLTYGGQTKIVETALTPDSCYPD